MRNSRGYTIVELLVVMAIMGLVGTVATTGYRAMVRGMEERGVRQNVNAFLAAAYQRAQIDQRPVVVYFWNEPIRRETDENYGLVVGRAVAVRPWGRLSNRIGNSLVDEFTNMENLFPTNLNNGASGASGSTRRLYALDDLSSKGRQYTEVYLAVSIYPGEATRYGQIPGWMHTVSGGNSTFSDWKPGTLYGLDFMQLELTAGYIFGSGAPDYASEQTVDSFVIRPGDSLSDTIRLSAVRQNGTQMQSVSIGESDQIGSNGEIQ